MSFVLDRCCLAVFIIAIYYFSPFVSISILPLTSIFSPYPHASHSLLLSVCVSVLSCLSSSFSSLSNFVSNCWCSLANLHFLSLYTISISFSCFEHPSFSLFPCFIPAKFVFMVFFLFCICFHMFVFSPWRPFCFVVLHLHFHL